MTAIKQSVKILLLFLCVMVFSGCTRSQEKLYFIDSGNGGSYICTADELDQYKIDKTKIQWISIWDANQNGGRNWKTRPHETACNDEEHKKDMESKQR